MAHGLRAHHGPQQGQSKESDSLVRAEEESIHPGIRVIGTAGHVDHGKSTLISALTGVHPDRLMEEQRREMTIDLGFGWLRLPGGREIGIVDVPGHRDFVENMLAGVAGIDAVWLVVAADEGVMPQTREHLAIVNLLGIRGGILVLTKTDLVSDPALLDVAESELRAEVSGTTLEDAPVVRVSAINGGGLPALLNATAELLDRCPPRPNLSRPRLSLDRVFSMDGYGTVVTGTLIDGDLAVADDIEILPTGLRGRVRGLQNHRRQVDVAVPGGRTAVNVAGIAAGRLRRGDVLIHPGQYSLTKRIDAHVRILPRASTGLAHNREVKLFVGTSETLGRVRLLGAEQLRPGDQGWIQLELQQPVVCARGDAFVIRVPSPPETVGGGTVVEPLPQKRHKRMDESVTRALQTLASGAPADILFESVVSQGPGPVREIVRHSRLPAEAAAMALVELQSTSRLVSLGPGKISVDSETLVLSSSRMKSIEDRIALAVAQFHSKFPLRPGMPREELKNNIGLEARSFQAVLERMEARGTLFSQGGWVALTGHKSRLAPSQQSAVDSLMQKFDANPTAPPSARECVEAIGQELFASLREQGKLVAVSADIVFSAANYDAMVQKLKSELEIRQQISLADVRDLFGTSRRYAQALLEHLDRKGITRRLGDVHTLAQGLADGPPSA